MYILVDKLPIIGSGNGLSPGRHEAIMWTNAEILWIGPLGTNFSEIFKKMHLKMPSTKWWPSYINLNVLRRMWYMGLLSVLLSLVSNEFTHS